MFQQIRSFQTTLTFKDKWPFPPLIQIDDQCVLVWESSWTRGFRLSHCLFISVLLPTGCSSLFLTLLSVLTDEGGMPRRTCNSPKRQGLIEQRDWGWGGDLWVWPRPFCLPALPACLHFDLQREKNRWTAALSFSMDIFLDTGDILLWHFFQSDRH